MEGNEYEFDLFKECEFDKVEQLMDFFPFSNSFEPFEKENDNFNFFIFPDVEDYNPFSSFDHKNPMDGDQLLEKITKCEENYNNLLQNNLMASPTASKLYFIIILDVKDKISENFEENLILAEGTLPGLIISIMHRENCPVPENQLLNEVFPKFEELRKVNGSKYNVRV
jgi:hypothetical protein